MHTHCLACDTPLTGKQRKFCSESCRKRYSRMSVNHPGLSGNRPISMLNVRESSGFVRESSAIGVVILIKYNDNGWGDVNRKMDAWSIKTRYRAALAKYALKWLETHFERWSFELVSIDVVKK